MRVRWVSFLIFLTWTVALPAADDASLFENHCASCHGTDGRARTPQGRKIKARDLRESKMTDEEIARQIRFGSQKKTGVSVMPPVGSEMSDAEIQALVQIVKAFRAPLPAGK